MIFEATFTKRKVPEVKHVLKVPCHHDKELELSNCKEPLKQLLLEKHSELNVRGKQMKTLVKKKTNQFKQMLITSLTSKY